MRRPVLAALACLSLGCDPADMYESAPDARPADARPAAQSREALFAEYCATCHADAGGTKAPSLLAMNAMSPALIVFSMTNGRMKTEAAALSFEQQLMVADYIGKAENPNALAVDTRCADTTVDPTPRLSRWGFDAENSGRVPAGTARVTSENVARLELRWAFGLPRAVDARSQPAITADTLFIASSGGALFALDRYTGCTKWRYDAPVPLRTALTLGALNSRPTLFFGDASAHVTAVDALTGEAVWRTETRVGEHSILTGAVVQHEDRLVVPVSSYEVALARDPSFECCKTHGAVMSLAARDGRILWTTHMTESATARGVTAAGVTRWGPSGVSVWSTPTVDAVRGVVYVGTAQNASSPATAYSDSVLALALENGDVVWHFQAMAGDAYNDGCATFPRGPNCPTEAGPDFDIGAAVILAQDSAGIPVLLVGQKSGDVYAIDPDAKGALRWQKRVGSGSALGGIHWGLAVRDHVVFAPVSDPPFPLPGYVPRPGVHALNIDDGSKVWSHAADPACTTTIRDYFSRTELYPACSFFYGFSAAPTVVNDLLFAPSLDGRVNAFDAATGALRWQFDTIREFDTVNGVTAHGGSIDSAGVQAVGEWVYVQSGYSVFGQLPGNVLLAFRLTTED